MGYYFTFYNPIDMKKINEGKFAGIPFYQLKMFPDNVDTFSCYTGIMDRNMALEYQKIMPDNQSMFTDMMD